MTPRAKKILDILVKRISKENTKFGDEDTILELKQGGTLRIVRFYNSDNVLDDDYDLFYNHRKRLMRHAELASIANYIDETY